MLIAVNRELSEIMPDELELAGIIHDAADGGTREEYCSWTMANRAASDVNTRLRTVKSKSYSDISTLLEWVANEAARGLDEGDCRDALTAIKWKIKDTIAREGTKTLATGS